jgi:hypothetical protein
MRTNRDLIFPLVPVFYFMEEILIPKHPKECCEFLYGKNWIEPKSKSKMDYINLIHDGRPITFFKGDYIYALLEERRELQQWSSEAVDAREWWKQQYDSLMKTHSELLANSASQTEWLKSVQEGKDWLEKQWREGLQAIEQRDAIIRSLKAAPEKF